MGLIGNLISSAKKGISDAFDTVDKEFVKPISKTVSGGFDSVVEVFAPVTTAVKQVTSEVVPIYESVTSGIGSAFEDAKNTVTGFVTDASRNIESTVSSAQKTIGGFIDDAQRNIDVAISSAQKDIFSFVDDAKVNVSNAIDGVNNFFGDAQRNIISAYDDTMAFFTTTQKNLESFVDVFGKGLGNVQQFVIKYKWYILGAVVAIVLIAALVYFGPQIKTATTVKKLSSAAKARTDGFDVSQIASIIKAVKE